VIKKRTNSPLSIKHALHNLHCLQATRAAHHDQVHWHYSNQTRNEHLKHVTAEQNKPSVTDKSVGSRLEASSAEQTRHSSSTHAQHFTDVAHVITTTADTLPAGSKFLT
jgi:hypothetical protein